MHYACSENKGADQLRGYREADLRLCFRICKKPVFSRRGSNGRKHQMTAFSTTYGQRTRKMSIQKSLTLHFGHCLTKN